MNKLTIGRITYTNSWPIYHFFNIEKFQDKVEFIPQVPSQLNRQMAEGSIDIGLISSFSYAEHADKYILLPDLSVSAFGTIGSITLFLKNDLKDVVNKKIALTNTSATSVNLLKIIIEEFMGGKPEYITMPPKIDLMMHEADAALLIGDEALLAGLENERTRKYQIIDLGDQWRKRTNQWMTFAVFAVRKEVLTQLPELLYRVYQEFIYSKTQGKNKIDAIISESISKYGGTYQFWNQYFSGLSHDFGNEQIRGLKHYYQLAEKISVLDHVPEIELIDFEASSRIQGKIQLL